MRIPLPQLPEGRYPVWSKPPRWMLVLIGVQFLIPCDRIPAAPLKGLPTLIGPPPIAALHVTGEADLS
jgi:hypothetical protein